MHDILKYANFVHIYKWLYTGWCHELGKIKAKMLQNVLASHLTAKNVGIKQFHLAKYEGASIQENDTTSQRQEQMKNTVYNRNDDGNWVATILNSQHGKYGENGTRKKMRLYLMIAYNMIAFSLICSSTDFYVLIFQILKQMYAAVWTTAPSVINDVDYWHCFITTANKTNLYLSQAHEPWSISNGPSYFQWKYSESTSFVKQNQIKVIPYTTTQ